MAKSLAAWFLVAIAAASPTTPPRELIETAVSRVVALADALPDPPASTDLEEYRGEVRRIAAGLFDFDEMSRRALGRHWTARTPAQRVEFVTLFTDMLERTYVGRIDSRAVEAIAYPGEQIDGSFAVVRSRISMRKRTEMSLDYRLHLDEGRWRVYDISVDGVSFVSTYRSEFNRIIQSSSYASLVERLRSRRLQVDALASPSARR
jgi:phospholipid transport system substrate-binding protein